jgi:hypothetical protein
MPRHPLLFACNRATQHDHRGNQDGLMASIVVYDCEYET